MSQETSAGSAIPDPVEPRAAGVVFALVHQSCSPVGALGSIEQNEG
jgi:hypothetical protein